MSEFPQVTALGRIDKEGRYVTERNIADLIRRGKMFRVFGQFNIDAETTKFLFTTGTKPVHIYGSVDATFNVYENPTVTDEGDEVTPLNKNRASALTCESTVYHNTVTSANGTLIDPFQLSSAKKAGGDSHTEYKWVFAPETSYLFTATSAGANNDFILKVDFYEEDTE